MTDDPLYTSEEIAARYRTVPATVRYWRYIGYGPKGTKYGRRVLYAESELLRWEQAQRNADKQPAA